jgi:SsrA-binding protein
VASDGIKVIAKNRKAHHDYFIEETYEAGIVLTGTEVKSIRLGKVNLKDSYADVKQGEVYLHNMHISPYEKGNIFNSEPMRDRKLLLNRREINKLIGYIQQKGYSLIPLQIYLTRGLVKVQLAAAKGKKEIRLNEEYGGFTQLWDVYEEVTEYDLELLDTVESEMKFRKEEIQKESKKLNQARKEMYQVCLNEIKPVYDTITELKAGILVLEERRKNLNQKLHDL